jgi:uncharacterized protein
MIVVSDTTVLTILMKCGMASLLNHLYGIVVIPDAVFRELKRFHEEIPSFIEVRSVSRSRNLPFDGLGQGETEAILIALELKADLFVSDDRRARAAAAQMGLAYSGLLGIATEAKSRGIVSSAKELIETFQNKGGLYLSERVKKGALRAAGE